MYKSQYGLVFVSDGNEIQRCKICLGVVVVVGVISVVAVVGVVPLLYL